MRLKRYSDGQTFESMSDTRGLKCRSCIESDDTTPIPTFRGDEKSNGMLLEFKLHITLWRERELGVLMTTNNLAMSKKHEKSKLC